jgi:hypothetical protein
MSYMISLPYETLKTSYLLSHSNCLNFCDPEDVFKTIRPSQNLHFLFEKRQVEIQILVFTLYGLSDPKRQYFISHFLFINDNISSSVYRPISKNGSMNNKL